MSKTFSVQDVASLNKRIEQLNVEGTRTETRISMLTEQLATGLREYESQYGVNLSGKTLKKTAELIKKEYETILSAISEEYELKSRIVEAIQRSDIDEANRLLGIAQDAPEEEPEVAVEQEVPKAASKAAHASQISPVVEEVTSEDFDEDDSDYGVGSADTDMGADEDTDTDEDTDADEDTDGDNDDEDEVTYDDEDSEVMDAEEDDIEFTEDSDEDGYADIEEDFDLDEEDDVQNTGRVSDAADFMKAVQQQQSAQAHPKKPSAKTTTASASGSTRVTKPVSGSSVAATVENLGGGADFDIDLDDEDFGFGATLSGSKFVPQKG